jgi:hypothetical protein
VLGIVLAALALRTVWLRADPPTYSTGVVWHDEGAWTHNARNQALWGVWVTDNWNPVFIAPVFTAMEYAAFEIFGVGTWQARTVPVASGLVALLALMAGLRALSSGSLTMLIGGALLAVNFTWVTWNRAALMESTMTMFMVVAWAAYSRGSNRPAWGLMAGGAAALAWFTKAAAAFFVAGLVLDAAWTLALARLPGLRARWQCDAPSSLDVRNAWLVLAGLASVTLAVVALFVWPHWSEYWFYNFQMTVLRKPTYDLRSLADRASWLPVVHDIFTRMWLVLLAGSLALAAIIARWRTARPGERLLVLWIVLGLLELVVHDAGNERRYVMFIPAWTALAALLAGANRSFLPASLIAVGPGSRLAGVAIAAPLAYLVAGSLLRVFFQDDVAAGIGKLWPVVRGAAAAAGAGSLVLFLAWPAITGWLSRARIPPRAALVLTLLVAAYELSQFARWAATRTELNYQASILLGTVLPAETLVHGKLANGMALENRIRPIFVGQGFGNYDDRLVRDDARYILTYSLPEEGRESYDGLIREILNQYPGRQVIHTFDVQETPALDQAVLIDKRPSASGSQRAPD